MKQQLEQQQRPEATPRSKSKKKKSTKSPKKMLTKKLKKKNYLNPNTNAQIGQTNAKVLSLKQIKQLINDIMNQKVKFDKKCLDSRQPRETMEQFMYTFFNQKYGLKNLIIE